MKSPIWAEVAMEIAWCFCESTHDAMPPQRYCSWQPLLWGSPTLSVNPPDKFSWGLPHLAPWSKGPPCPEKTSHFRPWWNPAVINSYKHINWGWTQLGIFLSLYNSSQVVNSFGKHVSLPLALASEEGPLKKTSTTERNRHETQPSPCTWGMVISFPNNRVWLKIVQKKQKIVKTC
jgi:hypothetical protein